MSIQKKSSKAVTLLLAIVLMLALAPTAFAAGDVDPVMELSTDTTANITPGQEVEIYVTLHNNDTDTWKSLTLSSSLTFLNINVSDITIDGVNCTSSNARFQNGLLEINLVSMAGNSTKEIVIKATINNNIESGKVSYQFTASGKNSANAHRFAAVGMVWTVVRGSCDDPAFTNVPYNDATTTITGIGTAGQTINLTFDGYPNSYTTTVAADNTWTFDAAANGITLYVGQVISAYQSYPGWANSGTVTTTVVANTATNPIVNKTNDTNGASKYVNDTVQYNITVWNDSTASSVLDAVVTDTISPYVDFQEGSVTVNGATWTDYTYNSANRLLTINAGQINGGVGNMLTITFDVVINDSAYGQTIENTAYVGEKPGVDPGPVPVQDKSPTPSIDTPIYAGDQTITGTGEVGGKITVYWPDGTTISENIDVVADPDNPTRGIWEANVPAGVTLSSGQTIEASQKVGDLDDSDRASARVEDNPDPTEVLRKTSDNITTTDSEWHVGDTIRYTVTVGNTGSSISYWTYNMVDVLPSEVDWVGNVTLNGSPIATYDYNAAAHTLTYDFGTIYGGDEYVLTFDVKINDSASGKSGIVNSLGDVEDVTPPIKEKTAPPTINEVVENQRTITGEGIEGATIVVTSPEYPDWVAETTVKPDGTWEVDDIPFGVDFEIGDTIQAVQTEGTKDPSNPAETTVVGDIYPIPMANITWYNPDNEDTEVIEIGDTITYYGSVWNGGTAASSYTNALLVIQLSEHVTFNNGSSIIVGGTLTRQYDYDAATNTLRVYIGRVVGSIAGGSLQQITVNINTRLISLPTDNSQIEATYMPITE